MATVGQMLRVNKNLGKKNTPDFGKEKHTPQFEEAKAVKLIEVFFVGSYGCSKGVPGYSWEVQVCLKSIFAHSKSICDSLI